MSTSTDDLARVGRVTSDPTRTLVTLTSRDDPVDSGHLAAVAEAAGVSPAVPSRPRGSASRRGAGPT